jgi:hypothetical protein
VECIGRGAGRSPPSYDALKNECRYASTLYVPPWSIYGQLYHFTYTSYKLVYAEIVGKGIPVQAYYRSIGF